LIVDRKPGRQIAAIKGFYRAAHKLHVLLRHRLLRQPGGFEGFLGIKVGPNPNPLPVPSSDEPGHGRIDLDTTLGAMRMHATECKQSLSEVRASRELETKVVERFEQVLNPLPTPPPPPKPRRPPSQPRPNRRMPFHRWVELLQHRVKVLAVARLKPSLEC